LARVTVAAKPIIGTSSVALVTEKITPKLSLSTLTYQNVEGRYGASPNGVKLHDVPGMMLKSLERDTLA
jgi:hypothetical protein